MEAPAGWYPQQDGRLRYWDGTAWTMHHLGKTPRTAPVRTRRSVLFSCAILVLSVAVAYGVPAYGFMYSLLLPLIAYSRRELLWPTLSRRAAGVAAVLAVTGLWLPALLDFFTGVFYYSLGTEVSTGWLIIPLCGPEDLLTWVIPAAAATLLVGVGVLFSALRRTPWFWVAAMWLAPWAHMAVFSVLPQEFIC